MARNLKKIAAAGVILLTVFPQFSAMASMGAPQQTLVTENRVVPAVAVVAAVTQAVVVPGQLLASPDISAVGGGSCNTQALGGEKNLVQDAAVGMLLNQPAGCLTFSLGKVKPYSELAVKSLIQADAKVVVAQPLFFTVPSVLQQAPREDSPFLPVFGFASGLVKFSKTQDIVVSDFFVTLQSSIYYSVLTIYQLQVMRC
jgi:hypothetical protein